MHTNAYVCKYALYTCTQFFFFITLNVSIPEKHYAESVVGGDAEMYLLQPNVIFCMGITD